MEGPLRTNTSSASILVTLAILQVNVLVVVSLEIARPRILDEVVKVIGSSSIPYISCTSVQIFWSTYDFIVHQPVYFPLILWILPLSMWQFWKGV